MFGSIAGVVKVVEEEDVSNPVDETEIEGNDVLACLLSSDTREGEGRLLSQAQQLSLRSVKLLRECPTGGRSGRCWTARRGQGSLKRRMWVWRMC